MNAEIQETLETGLSNIYIIKFTRQKKVIIHTAQVGVRLIALMKKVTATHQLQTTNLLNGQCIDAGGNVSCQDIEKQSPYPLYP